MAEFASGPTRRIPAAADDPRSQEMTLFVGMPLVCWKSKEEKTKVILANSEMWLVAELGEEKIMLRRKLEEVDREAGKTQEEMPTLETAYSDLQGRFRPGYCITVHMSQGKRFVLELLQCSSCLLSEEGGGLWQRIPAEQKRLRRKVV